MAGGSPCPWCSYPTRTCRAHSPPAATQHARRRWPATSAQPHLRRDSLILPHLHRDSLILPHLSRSPLPHLRRDCAHPAHICARTAPGAACCSCRDCAHNSACAKPTRLGQPAVAGQHATRNTQHATRNMQHATHDMQQSTCKIRRAKAYTASTRWIRPTLSTGTLTIPISSVDAARSRRRVHTRSTCRRSSASCTNVPIPKLGALHAACCMLQSQSATCNGGID